MADTSYQIASGKRMYAGRQQFPHAAVLDLIAAAPGNSWVQLNTNDFQDSWAIDGLRPSDGGSPAQSRKVLGAWASIGWDTKRHGLVLFGGGHANTTDSAVYQWSAVTRQWSMAYNSPDWVQVTDDPQRGVVGDQFAKPLSSHTYDNQLYLPTIDRFYTPGGANAGLGLSFTAYDLNSPYPHTTLRVIPVFLLDMTLAGQGYTSGETGTNPKWYSVDYNLPGARAWDARDWHREGMVPAGWNEVKNCTSGTRVENGHDVVYQTFRSQTAKSLARIEFVTAGDFTQDMITKVGSPLNGRSGTISGTLYDSKDLFVCVQQSDTYPIFFWDLTTAAPAGNLDKGVAPGGITGAAASEFIAAMSVPSPVDDRDMPSVQYDPVRDRLLAWAYGGRVFSITAPSGSPTPTTGWSVEIVADPATTPPARPMTTAEMIAEGGLNIAVGTDGVCGRWRYAADLDVCIGVQHAIYGDVWAFKPVNWQDPRT